ncbi:MAG: phosphomannomutase/phosphoglucomutase [Candidatus Peregrinibacteria bacterium]|nr:phosphomannomutase/phosphoglucomutase [Candidatus Peregrinibacteria bacterium]
MSLNPRIFRAYDIRGKAESQITPEACKLIGQAFGSTLREMYGIEHPRVALGWDARTHSPLFAEHTQKGLQDVGCSVVRIGLTPSPVNYFTVCMQKLDGSIQITASHNPAEDNGLKLQLREAHAYAGDDLQTLRKKIEAGKFLSGSGRVEDVDAITPYIDHLSSLFPNGAKGLSVVVDSGNGVAGPTYCRALRAIGATVDELYTEPDGTFPNHLADPSKHATLKDLQKRVTEIDADIGLAFDGDGDRLGVVDEHGRILTADEVILLLAEDHLKRHPGSPVIFTVSNSGILESEVARMGGKPIMCKVGHSFVEHAMREHGALLGGEQSGHFFCGEDYFSFDDALVAALRVLSICTTRKKPISVLIAAFPQVFQAPELRPHCPDDAKTGIIERVTKHFAKSYPVNTLDGVRIDFGDHAWAGIRQSNTSPCLSICMEARSEAKLKEVREIVLSHLQTYPELTWDN